MADLFTGLMSGTRMDGIDAALVDLSSTRPTRLSPSAAMDKPFDTNPMQQHPTH
jgi:1,6-anhydro-N-acetylmuramate kinase